VVPLDNCCLPIGISVLACSIAKNLNDDDLDLLAAVLSQLGQDLSTIAIQRSVCRNNQEEAAVISSG